jgi:hypothetical protein
MVARCQRQPGQMLVLIGDKNFRGKTLKPHWLRSTRASNA